MFSKRALIATVLMFALPALSAMPAKSVWHAPSACVATSTLYLSIAPPAYELVSHEDAALRLTHEPRLPEVDVEAARASGTEILVEGRVLDGFEREVSRLFSNYARVQEMVSEIVLTHSPRAAKTTMSVFPVSAISFEEKRILAGRFVGLGGRNLTVDSFESLSEQADYSPFMYLFSVRDEGVSPKSPPSSVGCALFLDASSGLVRRWGLHFLARGLSPELFVKTILAHEAMHCLQRNEELAFGLGEHPTGWFMGRLDMLWEELLALPSEALPPDMLAQRNRIVGLIDSLSDRAGEAHADIGAILRVATPGNVRDLLRAMVGIRNYGDSSEESEAHAAHAHDTGQVLLSAAPWLPGIVAGAPSDRASSWVSANAGMIVRAFHGKEGARLASLSEDLLREARVHLAPLP